MKLETIKTAIREWNEINDYSDKAFNLLKQGVLFKINPNVLQQSTSSNEDGRMNIHAYPGVIEGRLKFFLINSFMDTEKHFDDKNNPITNYIFVSDLEGMSEALLSDFEKTETNGVENINPLTAKERVLSWSLSNESWIKSQINNTEGMFEAFVIPIDDLKPESEIYALFALSGNQLKNNKKTGYTSDLIIWDRVENFLMTDPESGLYDLVRPVPPFEPIELSKNINSPRSKENFYLLNISYHP